jgi:hypothetical protein
MAKNHQLIKNLGFIGFMGNETSLEDFLDGTCSNFGLHIAMTLSAHSKIQN